MNQYVWVAAASPGLAPAPTGMLTQQTAARVFVAVAAAGMVVACLCLLRTLVRDRTPLFLLIALGGALTFFSLEALGDILGGTWYPVDTPFQVLTMLGRHLPLYVLLGWTFGTALGVYYAYRMMKAGVAQSVLYCLIPFCALGDLVMEGTFLHLKVYTYYSYDGPNPATIAGLPVHVLAETGLLTVGGAWAIVAAEKWLHGWRWLLVIPAVPIFAGATAVGLNFPAYLAINSPVPAWLAWVATLVSSALNIAVVVAMIKSPLLQHLRDLSERTRTPAATA